MLNIHLRFSGQALLLLGLGTLRALTGCESSGPVENSAAPVGVSMDAAPPVTVDTGPETMPTSTDAAVGRSDSATDATMPRDAEGPSFDAGERDAAPLELDAASPREAGADAETAPDAGPPEVDAQRAPVFQKTRCIDPADVQADREINFPCDGVDVWVVVPKPCEARPCGLIFNIHGGGMNDHTTMEQATNMIALGSQAGYVVVHPHKGTWDVASDKDTVFGLMQQVIEAFDVDPKRVHATGYSQGGQISWALGCEHADVIASIAPTEEINRVSQCWKTDALPARELSVLFAYGKQDTIGGGFAAAQDAVSQFVSAYSMQGPETLAGAEDARYFRQRWSSESGEVLEFIAHDYTSSGVLGILAGHCLPMATGTTFVNCSPPVDYDWGEEVVRFFQAHPMP